MEDSGQGTRRRAHLAKRIEEKLGLIERLRAELGLKKKTAGPSVDDQISIAELEYHLVKEEMALLTLQEQHWESAALWDKPPHTPDIQREVCEVLHSYILSVQEKGALPALHASEHLTLENAVLVSSVCGDKPSLPRVEWAHHATDLQAGDRLLEVNGSLVVGLDSMEVNRLLGTSRPVCRLVFLRPFSPQRPQPHGGSGRETSNLRHELTAVVGRLNHKMIENARLKEKNARLQNESEDLKVLNRKLKLQVLSLQSVLLYLYQILEKNKYQVDSDTFHSELFSQCSSIFDLLSKNSDNRAPGLGTSVPKEASSPNESISDAQLSTNTDTLDNNRSTKPPDVSLQEINDIEHIISVS